MRSEAAKPSLAVAGPFGAKASPFASCRARWPSRWPLALAASAACGLLAGHAAYRPWLGPLGALIFLVPLAALVLEAALTSARRSAVLLGIGVLAMHATACYWAALVVPDSVAGAAAWRIALIVLLAGVQAAWSVVCWALALWCLRRMDRMGRPQWMALAWALAWWSADVLRSAGWWGDGYGTLAIALIDLPGSTGWLAWIGADGVAACAALAAAWPCAVWRGEARGRTVRAWWPFSLTAVAWVAAGIALDRLPLPGIAPPHGELQVTALQASRDKRAQWTLEVRDSAMDRLLRAIDDTPAGGVVIAPETYFADSLPPPDAPGWTALPQRARQRQVHVLVGMPLLGRDGEGRQMMNAVVQVAPERQALYAKERLVVGAEYIPWPVLLQPLLAQVFDMALKSQRPAPPHLTAPLYVSGHWAGVSICHELSFAATMAARAAGSELLVNVADDNWIPNADYLELMRRIARLRAAEAGKPLVRVSNGAPAWWVDAHGHLDVLPGSESRPHVMNVVAPRAGLTPFHATVAVQRALPLALLIGAAGWSVWRGLQRQRVHP